MGPQLPKKTESRRGERNTCDVCRGQSSRWIFCGPGSRLPLLIRGLLPRCRRRRRRPQRRSPQSPWRSPQPMRQRRQIPRQHVWPIHGLRDPGPQRHQQIPAIPLRCSLGHTVSGRRAASPGRTARSFPVGISHPPCGKTVCVNTATDVAAPDPARDFPRLHVPSLSRVLRGHPSPGRVFSGPKRGIAHIHRRARSRVRTGLPGYEKRRFESMPSPQRRNDGFPALGVPSRDRVHRRGV
jgi:hypothetical protein